MIVYDLHENLLMGFKIWEKVLKDSMSNSGYSVIIRMQPNISNLIILFQYFLCNVSGSQSGWYRPLRGVKEAHGGVGGYLVAFGTP